MSGRWLGLILVGTLLLAGCAGSPKKPRSGKASTSTSTSTTVVTKKGGGYYKDDGPGSGAPTDLDRIPNAVPRIEPLARANTRPYTVLGKSFVPHTELRSFRQTGTASWYGRKFHGKKTANGETYDMYAMTAAHPTLPLPSYARVTRPGTGQSVIVRINDRGPFHSARIIDLSYVAAAKLGLIAPGSGTVVVESITAAEIQSGQFAAGASKNKPSTKGSNTGLKAETDRDQHGLEALINATTPDEEPATTAAWSPQAQDRQLAVSPDGPAHAGPRHEAGIYLQFGAFAAQQNASNLAARLNQQIGQVEVRSAEVEAVNALYRVQIGPYHTRTEAVNAAQRIHQETGIQASLSVR